MNSNSATIRKILVLVDFSEKTQLAFGVALQLAKKCGASIKLLHVIDTPLASGYNTFSTGIEMGMVGGYQNYDFMLPELLGQSKQQMEKLLQMGTQEGIPMEQEVGADVGLSKLEQVVTDEHIDLVVMGSEGADGLEEFLIGSDADAVVRHCPCPVLTIKQTHEKFEIKNILFPSDFAPESVHLVPYIKFFQAFFQAHVNLLYIRTDNENTDTQIQERVQDFIYNNGLSHVSLIIQPHSSASDGIIQAIADRPHDLILMATHARTGLAHFFHKSIAESVVTHAAIPVLTFHWPVIPE